MKSRCVEYSRLDFPSFWLGELSHTKLMSCLTPPKYDEKGNYVITTGCATFDKQTSGIFTGNNFGDTIVGSYIRSYQTIVLPTHIEREKEYDKLNGKGSFVNDHKDNPDVCRKPGHLQDFDLDPFMKYLPAYGVGMLRTLLENEAGILYMLFHRGPKGRVIHGFILTDTLYRLRYKIWNVRGKSEQVIEAVTPYLAITPTKMVELANTRTERVRITLDVDVDVSGDINDFRNNIKDIIGGSIKREYKRANSRGFVLPETLSIIAE